MPFLSKTKIAFERKTANSHETKGVSNTSCLAPGLYVYRYVCALNANPHNDAACCCHRNLSNAWKIILRNNLSRTSHTIHSGQGWKLNPGSRVSYLWDLPYCALNWICRSYTQTHIFVHTHIHINDWLPQWDFLNGWLWLTYCFERVFGVPFVYCFFSVVFVRSFFTVCILTVFSFQYCLLTMWASLGLS